MTYLQDECLYRRAEEEEKEDINAGPVPILNNPLASRSSPARSAEACCPSAPSSFPNFLAHLALR